ncbi:hypothetical protein [Pedobacter nyackensis]|uniref:Right handed beta helix region n=1 Tax=Pedobacter nyackensis TaxID=475255 RepID=A0A1W2ETP0_9SPHI|nr:hypothetical protein [Pedobacter nyackensis]SMD12942.1 hypothetical protein SAMN04488101_115132 [Pedobacter nyackensis]
MHLILCALFFVFGCKKSPAILVDTTPPEIHVPPTVPNPPKDTAVVLPPNATILEVGTGSGNLYIDAKRLGILGNTVIKIKGGSYNEIQITNFLSEDNGTVHIENDGLVEMIGDKQLTFSNVKNIIFSGKGTPGIDKGFVFRDKNSDAASVQLKNNIDNFTLTNVVFKNLDTYNVIQYDSRKIYDGSDASCSKNLKFLNIDCDNTGTLIRFKGSAENGIISGLLRNVEIAYVSFKNSPSVGSAFVMENVDAYDIHNNLVQYVNQNNSNHNGVFYLQGNGKFYNNIIRDHQGNSLRAWVYSIGTTPQKTLIYNNIVINSREYSAFELQSFSRNLMAGRTTYTNAEVFNNTCGNLLPKGAFPAQILDLYSLRGGQCNIFNNIGYKFTLVGQNNTNFIWNELSDTKGNGFNNKYFKSYQEAGIVDENQFKLTPATALKNSGAALSGRGLEALTNQTVIYDIYGTSRSMSLPSIGAVE